MHFSSNQMDKSLSQESLKKNRNIALDEKFTIFIKINQKLSVCNNFLSYYSSISLGYPNMCTYTFFYKHYPYKHRQAQILPIFFRKMVFLSIFVQCVYVNIWNSPQDAFLTHIWRQGQGENQHKIGSKLSTSQARFRFTGAYKKSVYLCQVMYF